MKTVVRPLRQLAAPYLKHAAEILVSALAHAPSAWRDLVDAAAEVSTFIDSPERFAFGAIDDDELCGWIGAIRHSSFAWELHPLVVDPTRQRRGLGTLLVGALEAEARQARVASIWLGADDDFGGTNLYDVDLYPDVLGHLARLAPTKGHPFTFYRRLGYEVVGALPDVNGRGKHDILMAKRIG